MISLTTSKPRRRSLRRDTLLNNSTCRLRFAATRQNTVPIASPAQPESPTPSEVNRPWDPLCLRSHAPAAACRDCGPLRGIDSVMKPWARGFYLTVSRTKAKLLAASHTRGSPPCAAMLPRRHSSASPESKTFLQTLRAGPKVVSTFANKGMWARFERQLGTGRASSFASPRRMFMTRLTSRESQPLHR